VPEILKEKMDMGDTEQGINILENTVKFFAKQAYRTILICYRDMSLSDYESIKADNNDFETE